MAGPINGDAIAVQEHANYQAWISFVIGCAFGIFYGVIGTIIFQLLTT